VRQPAHDGALETTHTVKAAAANGLPGNQCEPALDQIEPRGGGWSKVQMEVRMSRQPLPDCGMLVSSVVLAEYLNPNILMMQPAQDR